jgi:DNA-binding MarR family transcriptional regulator
VEARDRYTYSILTELAEAGGHSQRTLASGAGIALGLANLLLRRLVRRGWVRVVQIRPNRVKYLLTPAGIAEKARMSRLFLQESLKFYASARERVGASLAQVSATWPSAGGNQAVAKPIVFFGSGEMAEIAYVCLQETDLTLIGIVGDRVGRFFGLDIRPCRELGPDGLGGVPFGRLVVTAFDEQPEVSARLQALGVPPEKVLYL